MAKSDTSKSKAEAYREERKQRIAKATKKNESGKKIGKLLGKIVAIVLAVAIALGAVWGIIDYLGVIDRYTTALKIGDYKLTSAEFNYYYSMAYQQTTYYSNYYIENYGQDLMGYDVSLAPDEQNTKGEDGKEISWADKFRADAVDHAQFVIAYYNEAVKAEYKLTDDEKKEIDETVESYRENATSNNFSLNAYLRSVFGAGFNESFFKKQLEKETIAQRFYDDKAAKLKEGITDESIASIYNADRKAYDFTDVRFKSFAFTTLTATDGETDDALAARQKAANAKITEEAKAVYAKVKDEATFISAVKEYDTKDIKPADDKADTKAEDKAEAEDKKEDTYDESKTLTEHASYDSMKTALTEKGANWLFAAERKAGEFTFIETDTGCYIIFCVKPMYATNSVSVRHCLVKFEAAAEDGKPTEEEKKAAREKADSLYKSWKDGEATEDAFTKMAKENTDDTGSADNGGLYEAVRKGQMVKNFEAWCFDPARKPGDSGIVESDYGYHIMYFIKNNPDDLDWKDSIRTSEGDKAFKTYTEDLLKLDAYKPVEITRISTYVQKEFCKSIKSKNAQNASRA